MIFPLLIFISCENNNLNTESKFRGMWRLERFEYFDNNSGIWLLDTTRNGYTGFIVYDGEGHMSVQITPRDYKNLNGQIDIETLSDDSLKYMAKLYSTNYSYFANYTLSENLIEHNVFSASDPGLCGKILKRNYEFNGDTLYLIPVVSAKLRKNRLKWIKS
jgi:hypothetical protein